MPDLILSQLDIFETLLYRIGSFFFVDIIPLLFGCYHIEGVAWTCLHDLVPVHLDLLIEKIVMDLFVAF